MENRIFVSNYTKWRKACEANRIKKGKLNCRTINEGIILPLRKIKEENALNAIFEGGVCDKDFQLIAGHFRKDGNKKANLSCYRSYVVDSSSIKCIDETVIFAGIWYPFFGHCLVDSMSRMWHILKVQENYRIVFLLLPNQETVEFQEFFELLGIPFERILIVNTPTKFSKIIIPDESFFSLTNAYKEAQIPYKFMADNACNFLKDYVNQYGEKIYLSRSRYQKSDGLNEEYYEEFFKRRGFDIVYPEQMPLKEQIYIVSHAKEIVCTMGTLSHLALFADNNIKLTCILRDCETITMPQMIINQIKDLDWYIVEGTKTPLPIVHTNGIFLFMPTNYFKDYLLSNNIVYSESEINQNITPDLLFEFFHRYSDLFSSPAQYKRIKGKTLFNVINELNKSLHNRILSANEYLSDNDSKSIAYEKKIRELEKELNTFKKSIFYKMFKCKNKLLSRR